MNDSELQFDEIHWPFRPDTLVLATERLHSTLGLHITSNVVISNCCEVVQHLTFTMSEVVQESNHFT